MRIRHKGERMKMGKKESNETSKEEAEKKAKEEAEAKAKEEAEKEEATPVQPERPTLPGRTAIVDINRTYRKGDVVPENVVIGWESRGILVDKLVK